MTADHEEIRELIDNWILWRDAGDWDRFRTVWRPEGRVQATWFQGTGDEFTGRFFDFLDKRDGRWGMVLRQPVYERDRIDPVEPGTRLHLDEELLAGFPEGYRHLAYLQSRIGYPVKTDMPGLTGPRTEALYALSRAWLAKQPDADLDAWS